MTQVLFIHVNPVVYMNLTNNNLNDKVFVKPLNAEFQNFELTSDIGINLPRIKELNLYTIKALKKSDKPQEVLKKYINSLTSPIAIKVNDIIYVPKYDLYKVKSIVFEKDYKEEITKLGLKLPKKVEVSQLSYSKYPCYLLDKDYLQSLDIGTKRISTTIPDLSHIMDYPFNVLNGYQYEFLAELRTYFSQPRKHDEVLEIIILETSKRNQIESILQGLAFNLNMIYDKESALDYCSISGIRTMFENVGTSIAPGIFHITHFKYLNLILEQSSRGQPSKKDKDSIEIRLSNVLKESIANLEHNLINKSEKLYLFIETDRVSEILPEVRQACAKVIKVPNPESPDDIINLLSRKELSSHVDDISAYNEFIKFMPKLLKKR